MGRPNFLASKRADRHHTLTMQDRLQDVSITYWGKPIDEALEPHLHGASKALTARTWSRWSKKYCVEMLKLVPLVSTAEANELLTAKMATLAVDTRDDGMRPCVVRYVLADVRRLLEQSGGVIGGSAVASGDKTFLATPPGRLGGEKQLVGHKKGRKRGKRAHCKMVK